MGVESNKETRLLAPEEAELQQKQSELAELEATLADCELELATLKASLHAFEARYLGVVGAKYAELDDIEAKIAESYARQQPKNKEAKEKAQAARERAQSSASYAEGAGDELVEDFTPSDELKKLFREIALKVHPDLANDPKDRERRHRFMAEANAAYEAGDEARLRKILREWETSPEAVEGKGVAADLVRTIRKIAQAHDRIEAITKEIEALKVSDLYKLYEEVLAAEKDGKDLLAEIAAKLDLQIKDAKTKLKGLTTRKRVQ